MKTTTNDAGQTQSCQNAKKAEEGAKDRPATTLVAAAHVLASLHVSARVEV